MNYASHCVFALTVCGNIEQCLFFLINISKRYHSNDNSECQSGQLSIWLNCSYQFWISFYSNFNQLPLLLCSQELLENSEGLTETKDFLFGGNNTDQLVSLDEPPSEISLTMICFETATALLPGAICSGRWQDSTSSFHRSNWDVYSTCPLSQLPDRKNHLFPTRELAFQTQCCSSLSWEKELDWQPIQALEDFAPTS